ncbi:MAG: Pyridoxamine 5'-phosphate oxidase [Methanomassiliicoccales archaeon PtaU1.Bin124]|nr:MAG: Pyridoxamine 5'-phosphate oxidase [Methanomassiliicoccales archaeon PtaU1.Bin124]
MRRNEKEVTSREEIDGYIAKATVCRVGLVDGDEAYIVPMDFGYVDGCFYFHSAKEGRKVGIIGDERKASFELEIDHGLRMVTDAYKCTHHFVCVMGTGTIGVVKDEEERMKGLRALMDHYTKDMYEMTGKCTHKTLVLRLRVETISCKRNG